MAGFVRASETWKGDLTYVKDTIWLVFCSRTLFNVSSICFVRFIDDAMYIAAELSISIAIYGKKLNRQCKVSRRPFRKPDVISLTQDDRAKYSASPGENATILCNLDFQNIVSPLTAKTKSVVDRLVDFQPPQSASTEAHVPLVIICL